LAADEGFCSNAAARFYRSVQFWAWLTISYSLGIRRTSPNVLKDRRGRGLRAGVSVIVFAA
jgi:hypothetical protein